MAQDTSFLVPKDIPFNLTCFASPHYIEEWFIVYDNLRNEKDGLKHRFYTDTIQDKKLCNALAKMWIYLKDNNLDG